MSKTEIPQSWAKMYLKLDRSFITNLISSSSVQFAQAFITTMKGVRAGHKTAPANDSRYSDVWMVSSTLKKKERTGHAGIELMASIWCADEPQKLVELTLSRWRRGVQNPWTIFVGRLND